MRFLDAATCGGQAEGGRGASVRVGAYKGAADAGKAQKGGERACGQRRRRAGSGEPARERGCVPCKPRGAMVMTNRSMLRVAAVARFTCLIWPLTLMVGIDRD